MKFNPKLQEIAISKLEIESYGSNQSRIIAYCTPAETLFLTTLGLCVDWNTSYISYCDHSADPAKHLTGKEAFDFMIEKGKGSIKTFRFKRTSSKELQNKAEQRTLLLQRSQQRQYKEWKADFDVRMKETIGRVKERAIVRKLCLDFI